MCFWRDKKDIIIKMATYYELSFQFESSCKVLIEDEFQVNWQILGSDILIWLKGRINEREYLAFGLSGSDTRTQMEGSDVVVVWQKRGSASDIEIVDYNLHSKQQVHLKFLFLYELNIIHTGIHSLQNISELHFT